MFYINNTTNY